MHYDLIILGAGAAGMMAAVAAGETILSSGSPPLRIALLEKNSQPGIKVLVCGGGRCNLTNAGSLDFLIAQFGRNGRFLTPALRHLDNDTLRLWFKNQGVPTHEEHDGKIYPDSNQARSIVDALVRRMHELHIDIFTGPGAAAKSVEYKTDPGSPPPQPSPQPSTPIENRESKIENPLHFLVTTHDARQFTARALILAVGGMSYQRMGTTGDGYTFAQSLGHSLVTPRPAIVGLLCKEEWPKSLQGLAVPDVEVRIETPAHAGPLPRLATGRPIPSINDLLFTHFGLSGPAVLNPSEIVAELLEKFPEGISLRIDFARHHTRDQLTTLFKSWQQTHGRKFLRTLLSQHSPEILITSTSPDQTWHGHPARVPEAPANSTHPTTPPPPLHSSFAIRHSSFPGIPGRLAQKLLELCQIPPDQTAAHLTAAQTHALLERLKSSRFTIHATRGFKEAMVTAGGVALTEVNPHTLQSKILPQLYLVGEVLDLTGPSGGYNLQLAFSTGHLAGTHAAQTLTPLHSEFTL